ncbi:efflux RND transporter periplasmic adaptor subunit [Pedomonas mirosovicensis]|uniref:efflux RND transporter periplasmic adaptor subunit n=1 Tax=Pedomonas mirosovicensis TaxID=2908641 RepID=UPI00216A947E|nr:efflux RND transporter periplasmic adaptor subunit [Pedomonas mirosovicensis]MCH8686598.1 efflux RND transporter periplasmic adaptor subunit [Pedomonas mirosovicensis]
MIDRKSRPAALAGLLCIGLAACGEEQKTAAPPPPEVVVQVIKPEPVPSIVELPGRLQAVRTAEVRARVDGIVERRLYEEGTDVAAGAVLFQIDPRPLKARLDAARAALRRAQAEATNARRDVERFRPLVARNAISKQEFDAAEARLAQAQADVESAEAQVEQARLDLGYATVTAPISGRAGRAQVTEGALVSASQGTLLTTIEQLDPIYVNFSQSSGKILQIRKDIESGRLRTPELEQIQVSIVMEDGTVYGKQGRLNFLDMAVDPSTGTVSLRAVVPNEERILLPGEFVRARVDVGANPNGITVPQKAVQLSAESASVLIVGDNNVVMQRPVRLGDLLGDRWIINEGLKPGERVIVEGLLKAQPGARVKVTEAQAKPAGAAAPPAGQGQDQAQGQGAAPVRQ